MEAASLLQENQAPTSVPSSPKSSLKSTNKKQHQNGSGPERVLKFAVPPVHNGDIVSPLKENQHERERHNDDEIDRSVNCGPQPPQRTSSTPQRSTPQHALVSFIIFDDDIIQHVSILLIHFYF